MKKLLFILVMFRIIKCFAQDPQLFENTWYLQKISIDNVDYFPPFSLFTGEIIFTNSDFGISHPYCEEAYGSPIIYENMDVFNLDDNPVILLGSCADPVLVDFMERHYSIYFLDEQFAENPFSYTINLHGNGIKILTVTNNESDYAIYGDELLSMNDFESLTEVLVYPNPSFGDVFVKSSAIVEGIRLVDIRGKVVLNYHGINFDNNMKLDLSSIESGIYFLEIITEQGRAIRKIIKK